MARKRAATPPPIEVGTVFLIPLAGLDLYGACRVLQHERQGAEHFYLVAATNWTGTDSPPLTEPRLRQTLREGNEAVRLRVSGDPPRTFRLLATIPVTAKERKLQSLVYSGWEYFPERIRANWLAEHDPETLAAEEAEERRQYEEAQRKAQEEERAYRATLTLESFRDEKRFRAWSGYVDSAVIRAARQIVQEACDGLIALGPDAPVPRQLDVLRHAVERFNDLDEEHDHYIDTICREDIGDQLFEMIRLIGLDDYEMLNDIPWRDW